MNKFIGVILFAFSLALVTNMQANAASKAKAKAVPAKQLFGHKKGPAKLTPRAYGFYAKGCLAGGEDLPVTGSAWQVMRLSRNRNWAHPVMIELIKKLAIDAKAQDGWPGLLVGDLAQPRGGPMLSGHASHQVGLDADIWLRPMPDRVLTRKERETMSAISVVKSYKKINPKIWTTAHARLIRRAASFPGYFVAKFLSRLASAPVKMKVDETLGKFTGKLVFYVLMIFVFIAVLGRVGVEVTSFAAIMAAAGFAIGLAFQGTLSNFASGVLLLVFRPFKVGDVINAAGITAKVYEIDLFTTTFDTPDNRRIVVPNSSIAGGTIENITFHGQRRLDVAVGVDYSADID